MRVIYDLQAHSFGPHGGVAGMMNAVISGLAASDPSFSALLYCPARPAAPVPAGPRIRRAHWTGLPAGLRARPLARMTYHALSAFYWRCHPAAIFHPSFYPEDADLLRLPTVVNIYDLVHESQSLADDVPDVQRLLLLKKRAVESAARVLCISEATRDAFLAHYRADPALCRVVPLAAGAAFRHLAPEIADDRLRTAGLADPARPFVLFVGGRHRYKNFHRLLAAYAQWVRNGDIDLVVAGAPRRSTDAAVQDLLPADGHVVYVPFPDDETLCALYNRARFFVYPSLNEGFGIPLLEAMASGCPLCLADIPAFREVACPVSVFFDPLSTEAMTAAFDAALALRGDPGLPGSQAETLARYSWAKCVAAVRDLYRELQ